MASNRKGYDRAYAHRTGRRSRPRDTESMANLLQALDSAVAVSREARERHARKNLGSRNRDLEIARATIEAAMAPARQESARCNRDKERELLWGTQLRRRTKAARYEKLRLMKMLGHWS